MNENDLIAMLDIVMADVRTMSVEQHREIMDNPRYDGLFHIIDDMLDLGSYEINNETEKFTDTVLLSSKHMDGNSGVSVSYTASSDTEFKKILSEDQTLNSLNSEVYEFSWAA